MDIKAFYKLVSIVCAALAIVSFSTMVAAAMFAFPDPFSPVENYLSDLGNSGYNPSGALFFNAGCMLTGVSTILFFVGLGAWPVDDLRKLTPARLLGAFSGLALIFVGIYSEDYGILHSISAGLFFISLVVSIVATDLALRKHPAFLRPIEYLGFLVALTSVVYLSSYLLGRSIIIVEWITVAGALIWMGLIAYNLSRLKPARPA